jgi:hypothetical protein
MFVFTSVTGVCCKAVRSATARTSRQITFAGSRPPSPGLGPATLALTLATATRTRGAGLAFTFKVVVA